MARNQSTRSRIVVDTGSYRYRPAVTRQRPNRRLKLWMALSVIGAAALATFLALFLTSRPNDPMSSTLDAQQTIPTAPIAMPSASAPTPTPAASSVAPAATPQPTGAAATPVDDAAIQAQIEKALNSDAALAQADISTIVEGGRVTIVGSVRSAEIKQRVERAVRAVKGIFSVDNQLVVAESSPQI